MGQTRSAATSSDGGRERCLERCHRRGMWRRGALQITVLFECGLLHTDRRGDCVYRWLSR